VAGGFQHNVTGGTSGRGTDVGSQGAIRGVQTLRPSLCTIYTVEHQFLRYKPQV